MYTSALLLLVIPLRIITYFHHMIYNGSIYIFLFCGWDGWSADPMCVTGRWPDVYFSMETTWMGERLYYAVTRATRRSFFTIHERESITSLYIDYVGWRWWWASPPLQLVILNIFLLLKDSRPTTVTWSGFPTENCHRIFFFVILRIESQHSRAFIKGKRDKSFSFLIKFFFSASIVYVRIECQVRS